MTSPVPISGAGYIQVPFVLDDDQLLSDELDAIAAIWPGWTPRDGHLEVWVLQAVARMVAQRAAVDANVSQAIFAFFGAGLLELPPIPGSAANMPITVTAGDNSGHTLAAGSVLTYPLGSGNNVAFTVATDIVIPNGSTSASGTAVATAVGSYATGLGAATMTLGEPQTWVSSVVSTAASSGGTDAETTAAYLNRLAADLQLLTPRPILPADFSALAVNVTGVYRAVTIDGYNTADSTSGNERMVTVVGVDATGSALSSPVKTAMQTYLDGKREVTFIVNVMDATYTTVDVTTTVKVLPSANPTTVQAAIIAALQAYLSKSNWGGGDQTPPTWRNKTTVRLYELAAVIGAVDGVDDVLTVVQGPHGGPLTAADFALTGVVPLPVAGTIVVTAS